MSFQKLAEKWPSSVVSRTAIEQFSGGLLSVRTMQNLDSLGEGPKRGRMGRKVYYEVDDLVRWMEGRSERGGA